MGDWFTQAMPIVIMQCHATAHCQAAPSTWLRHVSCGKAVPCSCSLLEGSFVTTVKMPVYKNPTVLSPSVGRGLDKDASLWHQAPCPESESESFKHLQYVTLTASNSSRAVEDEEVKGLRVHIQTTRHSEHI